jgi:hypothetical protein
VRVEAKEDASRLVDNGCTAGMRLFTMTNLAMRMRDLCDDMNLMFMTCKTNKIIDCRGNTLVLCERGRPKGVDRTLVPM